MKKNVILSIALIAFCIGTTHAQLAENPEDISPLLIGESIPEDVTSNMNSGDHNLSKLIQEKPSVILFYRGSWCPYCNQHLAAVGEVEKQILGLGYQLIAISPDDEDGLKAAAKKNKLNYALFSDSKGHLTKAMGIAFKAPERYKNMLRKSSGGENSGFLPVPSVFVVNKEGVIVFEYIAPNFKERISAGLLTAALKSLQL